MRKRFFLYSTFILWICLCLAASSSNYGLRIKSHDFNGQNNTSLLLAGGNPIDIGNGLELNFKADLRSAPIFGNILTLTGDKGQKIYFCIAPDENRKTYRPNIIIGDKLYPVDYTLMTFSPRANIPIKISLNKAANKIEVSFGGKKRTINYNLSGFKSVIVNFGVDVSSTSGKDTAPVDIYDVEVRRNNKAIYFWALRDHTDSLSYDRIENSPAISSDAIWLVDSHSQWSKVFSYHTDSELQYVFSQKQNSLYIFDDDSLIVWNLSTDQRQARAISGGNRVMRYSKYLYYNENNQTIYNFNLQRKIITSFNMTDCRWENAEPIKDEPAYINNTLASTGGDDFYVFGGYGFYRFNNELFHINTATGKFDDLNYSPRISPRTNAASTIVGNKLYIFGGLGNESGKQELASESYTDLWEIDLKTLKARRLWNTKQKLAPKMLYASQMIFNPKDRNFYVATTTKRILRIGLDKPDLAYVGDTIPTRMDFDVMNYSLYKSEQQGRLIVVLDKYKTDKGHTLEAYSIDLPILAANNADETGASKWIKWVVGIVVLLVIVCIIIILKKRKQKKQKNAELPADKAESNKSNSDNSSSTKTKHDDAASDDDPLDAHVPAKHYYDKHNSEIRMLGEFIVYDREGNDITSKFTPRTRNLMMMLFLHSAVKSKGIEIKQLDEELWPNMSEESARNNRNVYMRKLRVLLEEVGDIEIVNDKMNYKVVLGKDVFFDFGKAISLMTEISEGDESREILERTMELLLRGPLLPNISTEWLDDLKADYTNRALSLMHRLARNAFQEGKLNRAYHIADAIMVLDPFSEEALAMQCQILSKRKTVGVAKILYDKFCKTYEQAMGEKYEKSFAEVCKGEE